MMPPVYATLETSGYPGAGQSIAGPLPIRSRPRQSAELGFAGMVVIASLFLQRFGLHFGASAMYFVGPIGLLLGLRGLVRGELSFDRNRLLAYLGLLFCVLFGTVEQMLFPPALFVVSSPLSIVQFLLLSAFATLSFSQAVDELAFFSVVNKGLAAIAVAGVVQFVLQFANVSIFSFDGIVPASILAEQGWNLTIATGIGSLLKSNGFFLIEPSTFSQLMAVGFIIELLAFRRILYCALFVGGLMISFSGTGWIVLVVFIAAVAGGLGMRGVLLALGAVALLGMALLAVFLLAPDVIDVVGERATEVFRPGTSGHMRFITPFWALSDILARVPAALMFGIGGGMSEHLTLPYEYDVNTPIKIILEFGAPALICYVLLLALADRTPIQRAMVAPCLVLLLFMGSYLQFPPVLFFMLLLLSIARLRVSPDSGADSRR